MRGVTKALLEYIVVVKRSSFPSTTREEDDEEEEVDLEVGLFEAEEEVALDEAGFFLTGAAAAGGGVVMSKRTRVLWSSGSESLSLTCESGTRALPNLVDVGRVGVGTAASLLDVEV